MIVFNLDGLNEEEDNILSIADDAVVGIHLVRSGNDRYQMYFKPGFNLHENTSVSVENKNKIAVQLNEIKSMLLEKINNSKGNFSVEFELMNKKKVDINTNVLINLLDFLREYYEKFFSKTADENSGSQNNSKSLDPSSESYEFFPSDFSPSSPRFTSKSYSSESCSEKEPEVFEYEFVRFDFSKNVTAGKNNINGNYLDFGIVYRNLTKNTCEEITFQKEKLDELLLSTKFRIQFNQEIFYQKNYFNSGFNMLQNAIKKAREFARTKGEDQIQNKVIKKEKRSPQRKDSFLKYCEEQKSKKEKRQTIKRNSGSSF